ncbi:MAG: organic hydroperoxide resistance protein [Alphaproteobacteria bacterium]|nr:organic hydroperoxide resistance protein [Alphaproteobacteria bacterium]MBV9372294.1 organic hydroperoxide resistance protein [Alphaproteobacteria bacterium]MBV9899586.1 organic hydroperoxide resistance protein [Alphaproteobacteria bacterium]
MTTDTLARDKVLYTARAHTVGGRDGRSRTDDGRLDVKLNTPGTPGNGTNPEQLFAAGWSACFEGALAHVARQRKIELPSETEIDAEVDLRLGDDGFSLAARMDVSIPGIDDALARELIEAAHQTCPYSKATSGNIDVEFNIV